MKENMRITIHKTIDGTTHRHICAKPGPKFSGNKPVLVDLPLTYIAVMKARNAECGGCLSVNEQIRRAIRAYILDGLVYTNPLIH
jgi:hypothetical protein